MSATDFLGPLISSALRTRPKRHDRAFNFLAGSSSSFLNASNLLALGGLGWAAYEIWRGKQRESAAAAAGRVVTPGTVVEGDLPPPLPAQARKPVSGAPAIEQDVQRIVDLTLSAARCDGDLGEEEYGSILRTAREIGAEAMVRGGLERPKSLAQLVAGVSDRRQRESLYVYAYSIVRADEEVNPTERAWLQQLAGQLGLDPANIGRLEKETAYRIASMPSGAPRA